MGVGVGRYHAYAHEAVALGDGHRAVVWEVVEHLHLVTRNRSPCDVPDGIPVVAVANGDIDTGRLHLVEGLLPVLQTLSRYAHILAGAGMDKPPHLDNVLAVLPFAAYLSVKPCDVGFGSVRAHLFPLVVDP